MSPATKYQTDRNQPPKLIHEIKAHSNRGLRVTPGASFGDFVPGVLQNESNKSGRSVPASGFLKGASIDSSLAKRAFGKMKAPRSGRAPWHSTYVVGYGHGDLNWIPGLCGGAGGRVGSFQKKVRRR